MKATNLPNYSSKEAAKATGLTPAKMSCSRLEKLVANNKVTVSQLTADGLVRIKWNATGYKSTVQIFGL